MIGSEWKSSVSSTALEAIKGFGVLALIATMFSVSVAFAEEPSYELDIPSQDLNSALKALAVETNRQVLFSAATVNGYQSPAINGEYSTTEAMDLLLESTDLTYDVTESNVLLVKALDSGQRGDSDSKNLNPAPVSTTQASGSQTRQGTSRDEDSAAYGSNAEPGASDDEEKRQTRGQIETIVVVGSRNTGIRRYADDVQPYVVFNALEMQDSAATNVEEFLKTRLPQNAIQTSNSQVIGNQSGNLSSINLRGLGTNQTLILVNGRRMPGIYTGDTFSQPDINGIPLNSIERIEVLPSTASAIYGGGATGGAVNIILKSNYSGLEVAAGYNNTFDTDSMQRRIDISGGFSLEDGRTDVLFSGSFSDSNPLLTGERQFATRGRRLLLENLDGDFEEFGLRPGFTTNILSLSGDLVLDDGTSLGSPITHVPVGYAGPSSDGGAGLISNAGSYSIGLPNDLNGARASLVNNPTTKSASIRIRREFTEWLEVFVDTSIYQNNGDATFGSVSGLGSLQGDDPGNPFTNPIIVRYPVIDVSVPVTAESETLRAEVGAIARLPGDWSMQLDYGLNRSRQDRVFSSPEQFSLTNPAIVDGSIDIFADLNAFPVDWSPFVFDQPQDVTGPFDTELRNASLRFSGSALTLPGGRLTLSALVEHREETAPDAFADLSLPGFSGVFFLPERKQEVDSVYLEVLAPLVSPGNALRGVRRLELQASIRRDDYSTTVPSTLSESSILLDLRNDPLPEITRRTIDVDSTDYLLGFRYSPTEAIMLRASYGTGFLPPSLAQYVPSPPSLGVPGFIVGPDPKRGGTTQDTLDFVDLLQGGNVELQPEESRSWSAGFVFTPRLVENLRLSVDYTKIEKEGEIRVLSLDQVVANEDNLAGRVTRAALTDADAALGYTGGVVTTLDISAVNTAKTIVEAYDIQANYRIETLGKGDFEFYAVFSYQNTFSTQVTPLSEVVESAGFSGSPLDWRGNFGANWSRGDWALGWNGQYFDSYYVYEAGSPVADVISMSQGSETVPSQTYHDVFARYQFGKGFRALSGALSDTEVSVGIQNVFDKSPPILATSSGLGGYSTYGDPRLRRYSLNIRKRFQ